MDSLLSVSGFIIHLQMLGKCCAIISKYFSRSYSLMYVSRYLTGPMSGRFVGPMVWRRYIYIFLGAIFCKYVCLYVYVNVGMCFNFVYCSGLCTTF